MNSEFLGEETINPLGIRRKKIFQKLKDSFGGLGPSTRYACSGLRRTSQDVLEIFRSGVFKIEK
jgi:hypothetical protein